MDWTLAIDLNRIALLRMLAALFALVEGRSGEVVESVPRHVHRMIARALRPAEAATRRLIAVVMLTQEITAEAAPSSSSKPRKSGKPRKKPSKPAAERRGNAPPAFGLFDPRIDVDPKRKTASGDGPRIWFFDGLDAPVTKRPVPLPDDPFSVGPLYRRLRALKAALDDLPGQARRLAQATARLPRAIRPMRPGRAPGHWARGKREIDAVLYECSVLAEMAYKDAEVANTS